jgi:hypothetical protein
LADNNDFVVVLTLGILWLTTILIVVAIPASSIPYFSQGEIVVIVGIVLAIIGIVWFNYQQIRELRRRELASKREPKLIIQLLSSPGPEAFGWKLRNEGGSTATGVFLGCRIPDSWNFSVSILNDVDLAPTHDIDIFFGAGHATADDSRNISNFLLQGVSHPHQDEIQVHQPSNPLRLFWDREFEIEIAFRYGILPAETHHYRLITGPLSVRHPTLSEV